MLQRTLHASTQERAEEPLEVRDVRLVLELERDPGPSRVLGLDLDADAGIRIGPVGQGSGERAVVAAAEPERFARDSLDLGRRRLDGDGHGPRHVRHARAFAFDDHSKERSCPS